MKQKRPNVPVFLIYAGIIHAIGLALLLPIMVTLPGPGSETAPEASVIDVEIIPASSPAAIIAQEDEQTAALPSPGPSTVDDAAVEDQAQPEPAANDEPEAKPEIEASQEKLESGEAPVEEKAKADAEKPAKAAKSGPAKKPVAARTRTAKPAARRPARAQTKIAPFNGAFSGLFSPGAPAKRR